DFKLSFNVLLVIMVRSSLCCDAVQFTNFVGHFRQELQDVIDNSDIRHLKYRSLGVLVNGDQERTSFDAREVLEGTTDAACQIDLGLDGFSGGAPLTRLFEPLGI